jgi:hypothetical protein
MILEAGKSKSMVWHLVRACLLHQNMVEGIIWYDLEDYVLNTCVPGDILKP